MAFHIHKDSPGSTPVRLCQEGDGDITLWALNKEGEDDIRILSLQPSGFVYLYSGVSHVEGLQYDLDARHVAIASSMTRQRKD